MGKKYTAAVTGQQRQMMFCILRDQEIIARKKKEDKRGYKIFSQLIFLACL